MCNWRVHYQDEHTAVECCAKSHIFEWNNSDELAKSWQQNNGIEPFFELAVLLPPSSRASRAAMSFVAVATENCLDTTLVDKQYVLIGEW